LALSRILLAFIIIAVLVASFKYFSGSEKQIFTGMVIGKSGDSVTVNKSAADRVRFALDTVSLVKDGKIIYKKAGGGIVAVKLQNANGIIETCKDAVNLCIGLIGIMALFMGFMSIAEKAGGIRLLLKIIGPFFSKIFPDIPKGHPSMGHMVMNFSANLLGLDNAATPFGIKAMESLQELNPDKSRATNAQVMFMCLHAAGLTLIPVAIIAARAAVKPSSANPTDIFVPCMIATFVATMAAMFIVSFKQKINIFQPVILTWVGGISVIIAALVWYLTSLSADRVQVASGILVNGILLLILFLIVLGRIF